MPRINIDIGGSAQAGIVMARKANFLPSDDDFIYGPLLYHIVFHSLGSRLYDIRVKTGIFYGAQGILGKHVTADDPGMDLIATKVETVDVDKTINELRKMLTKLRDDPQITEHELIAAKSWYEHEILDIVANPSRFASLIVQYKRQYPNDDNYCEMLRSHINLVNAMDLTSINELSRKTFGKTYDNIYIAQ